MCDYTKGCNKEQVQAIQIVHGPVLVSAGAGSGKTMVITRRMAHLAHFHDVPTSRMLIVTFTNRAAQELVTRAENLIDYPFKTHWIGTFHGLSNRILRKFSAIAGWPANFIIIDENQQRQMLKHTFKIFNWDEKYITHYQFLINLIKNRLTDPLRDIPSNIPYDINEVMYAYESYKSTNNVYDFGDLVLKCIQLWQQHQEILNLCQRTFEFLMVDEFQDINDAQYQWIRILAQKDKNIFCVGDEDQSIYSWRGAEAKKIWEFTNDFPNCQIIKLEQNYRSSQSILNAANNIIKNNSNRFDKTLVSNKSQKGNIRITVYKSERHEAYDVVYKILSLQKQKQDLKNIAIIVRTLSQIKPFEEMLITHGIPYTIVGKNKIFEKEEIRILVSYLHVILSSKCTFSFLNIINVPKRGMGNKKISELLEYCTTNGVDCEKALEFFLTQNKWGQKTLHKLSSLLHQIHQWRQFSTSDTHTLHDLTQKVINESGYLASLGSKVPYENRVENTKQFLDFTTQFQSLQELFDHISLITETEVANTNLDNDMQNTGKVTVMTVHAAKGTEYGTVFLVGWEEGILPHKKSLPDQVEEERRLAYVATTRSKQQCFISYCETRNLYGKIQYNKPSRFICEIMKK